MEIQRIKLLNGSREFCQEFLTDVRVPDSNLLGDVDEGWTVATRWLYHERTVAGGSPFVTGGGNRPDEGSLDAGHMLALARRLGTVDHQQSRELIGESWALQLVGSALVGSTSARIRSGELGDHAAAINRLFSGVSNVRRATIAFELAGQEAVAWPEADEELAGVGVGYLIRQAACIGGGTTEMARNVISERVLGMPREARYDTNVAVRDVPKSTSARG
jgi:alkylation response protein AidB-like acyl-CoA dehydrogenase